MSTRPSDAFLQNVVPDHRLLRLTLLVVDVVAAASAIAIVVIAFVQAPTAQELARLDPEAAWVAPLAAVVLVPLALLFALAAIAHWRRYPLRWLIQVIPVVLVGALLVFFLT